MVGHSDPPGDMLAARNAINDVLNEFCIITRAALCTARVQDAPYDSFLLQRLQMNSQMEMGRGGEGREWMRRSGSSDE